jgi:hypothetical protein
MLKYDACLSIDVEGRCGGLSVWDLLRELRDMSALPWCIIGDFNDLLSQEDKQGQNLHLNWLCDGFRSAIGDCDFTYIHLDGYPFTWIESRGSSHVLEERLDRAFTNTTWLMLYPEVRLQNLITSHYDHSPILLHTSVMVRNGNTYSFRFENIWLKEEDVSDVVEEGWSGKRDLDVGMDVTSRVSQCADKLQKWGKRKRMCFKQELTDCSEEKERLRGIHDSNSV